MKVISQLIIATLAISIMSGCIKKKLTYKINPDGSGKVDIVYISTLASLNPQLSTPEGPKNTSPKDKLFNAVINIITKTTGVDTWKDVTYKFTKNGLVEFKGTAYFPDFNDFYFFKPQSFPLTSNEVTHFILNKDKSTLSLAISKPKAPNATKKKSLLETKIEYQNSRPILQAMLANFQFDQQFIFSGKIDKFSKFTKVDEHSVKFNLKGKKIFNKIDKEILSAKQVNNLPNLNIKNDFRSLLLPSETFVRVIKNVTPLFDYKKEVAEAKKKWDKSPLTTAVANPDSLNNTPHVSEIANNTLSKNYKIQKLTSLTLKLATDKEDRKNYFLSSRPQLSIDIIQPFPLHAAMVRKAIVTKAEMNDGENILPKNKWERRVDRRLAQNKRGVLLTINLEIPKNLKAGIKIIEGEIEYTKGQGEQWINLGTFQLKDGETGKKFKAKIIRYHQNEHFGPAAQPHQKNTFNKNRFSLKISLHKDEIRALEFYDTKGNKLNITKDNSLFWSDTWVKYSFYLPEKCPNKVVIKLKTYQTTELKKLKFTLKNIDLLNPQNNTK